MIIPQSFKINDTKRNWSLNASFNTAGFNKVFSTYKAIHKSYFDKHVKYLK